MLPVCSMIVTISRPERAVERSQELRAALDAIGAARPRGTTDAIANEGARAAAFLAGFRTRPGWAAVALPRRL